MNSWQLLGQLSSSLHVGLGSFSWKNTSWLYQATLWTATKNQQQWAQCNCVFWNWNYWHLLENPVLMVARRVSLRKGGCEGVTLWFLEPKSGWYSQPWYRGHLGQDNWCRMWPALDSVNPAMLQVLRWTGWTVVHAPFPQADQIMLLFLQYQ